jgi:hypothetical protein
MAAVGALALWALPAVVLPFLVLAAGFAWLLPRPARWFAVLTWLLPFHMLVMAVLFGGLGLPSAVVRTIAAWKDAAIMMLLVAVTVRAATGRRADAGITWLDVVIGSLIALAVIQVLAGPALSRPDIGLVGLLYGLRDAAFFFVPYFIGRATPSIGDVDVLRRLFRVGVLTSAIGVVEWFFVPPTLLVMIGVAVYYSDFLGIGAMMGSNGFGLPANYWTFFGDMELRRAGSVYLSSQAFAIPFLLIIPAATAWLFSRRAVTKWQWLGYAILWAGLLLSVTRMTIVACLLQFFFLAILFERRGLAMGVIASALAILAAAAAAVPRLAIFLWQTLTWGHASSVSHSKDYLKGLNALVEYPLGAGVGTTDQTAVRFGLEPLAFDNLYLKMGVELGLPAVLLLLLVIVGVSHASIRLLRRGRTEGERLVGVTVLATTIGIAINAMTSALLGSFMLSYLYFWLAGTVVTLARRLDDGVTTTP